MDAPLPVDRFHLQHLTAQDALHTLIEDVRDGLFNAPRSLPPKYFYDDEGSRLFDAICETEDYYPTRTEHVLLEQHVDEIISTVQPRTCIELGAGTSAKTELLLACIDAISDLHTYITIDVCEGVMAASAKRLLKVYSNLQIASLVGEYAPALEAIPSVDGPALFIFIGSSIGNFTEQQSIELLGRISQKMTLGDFLLLGVDRVKDKDILERAYNDAEGITAKFNLNVLKVLNEKVGADFNLDQFSHQAIYNDIDEQIEMYLISRCKQKIALPAVGETITMQKNEKILTEISRKYTQTSIQRLLTNSGLTEEMHFQPGNEFFSLILASRNSRL